MPDTDELKRNRIERQLAEWESFIESPAWRDMKADLEADMKTRCDTLLQLTPCVDNVPMWAYLQGQYDAAKAMLAGPDQKIAQFRASIEAMEKGERKR